MKLVPIPGNNGKPMFWVNPEHVASFVRIDQHVGDRVQLREDLKVEGMPLQRVDLGEHPTEDAADEAWSAFLTSLDGTADH